MSHFYGTVQGGRGEATRCGHKSNGLQTNAAGWGGTIEVATYHDDESGMDMARIYLRPWQHSGGESLLIATVELNAESGMIYYPPMGGRRTVYRRL